MREGRGGGKECEVPTHLIKNSEFTHAARVTKNRQTTRYLAKKMAVCAAHNPPLRRDKAVLLATGVTVQKSASTVTSFA